MVNIMLDALGESKEPKRETDFAARLKAIWQPIVHWFGLGHTAELNRLACEYRKCTRGFDTVTKTLLDDCTNDKH